MENIGKKWIPLTKDLNASAKFLLIGAKTDIYNKKEKTHVSEKEALKFCKRYNLVKSIRCSALTYSRSNQKSGNVNIAFDTAFNLCVSDKGIVNNGSKCTLG